ncbi:MAG: serine hydrolase [Candidatus Eremiobacteraeota bacterium]|nr:serine hydrolase [Candidatus Eremiobacteraeota bacterium]MBC5804457.1 serine hydrolase [Candidatus Eremiobacteraeota bacterium]MBC5821214.1 serine hydrolase [Candidatus Eremiobacteraeota bacterium]
MTRSAFVAAGLAATCAPACAARSDVDARIARAVAASSGTVGVWARKLDAPAPIVYNPDVVFPTASISKVLILLSLFQLSEHNPAIFERRITLKLSDFVGGSEVLDSYEPGASLTVAALARAMIDQSDNTASNVLIDLLGFDRIAATIHGADLKHTQLKRHFMDVNAVVGHSENLTTPRDIGSLLYQIERGSHEGVHTVASSASCRKMIDILLRQEDRDKIARGLPKGVPLANKTGEIDGVRNDVGIIDPFGESPYVLAVLTKDLDDFSLGNIAIRRIATAVHGALY